VLPELHGHGRYAVLGVLDEHGSWSASGVPQGRAVVQAVVSSWLLDRRLVTAPIAIAGSATSAADLVFSRDGAVLDVIVRADRDASIPSAEVHVFPGAIAAGTRTIDQLIQMVIRAPSSSTAVSFPVDAGTATATGQPLYQTGDTHARIGLFEAGPATVCVVPFSGDLADDSFLPRVSAHLGALEVRCVEIQVAASPAVQAFVVETPPMKRLP
jgi:hypothetical protein